MTRGLDRIRDRKLVQWSLAYLAGAWVLLQVANLVGGHFAWPSWVQRVLIVLAAVGLVATLVVAWYHGERGRQRVSGPELLMLTSLLVVAGAAVTLVRGEEGTPGGEPAPDLSAGRTAADSVTGRRGPAVTVGGAAAVAEDGRPSARSVAVLPFTNLSADSSDLYFSDGITDDVLTALAKIGDLHVISRTSSMAYRETDLPLPEIGRELGAGSILEGSVRREGDRVRIVAQLIDARQDRHLWAETYDREITDLFAIQTEIAASIAEALRAELTDTERERILAGGTTNLDAYDLYLRGREQLRDPSRRNVEIAIADFRRALELDSDYALAHAGLSSAYAVWQEYHGVAWGDSAILAAARAISRDARAAEGYVAMAKAQGYWGLYDASMGNLRRALERNPNLADAVEGMATVLEARGRLDQALPWALRAVSLEPTRPDPYGRVGWLLVDMGADSAGVRWLRRQLRLAPGTLEPYRDLAYYHLDRGRPDRAAEHVARMLDMAPEAASTVRAAADVALVRGDLEAALDYLRRWHARQSDQWATRDVLGWVQMRLGRREEAEASLRQAEELARLWLGRGDQGAWPHLVLANVHLARGETDQALPALERWAEQDLWPGPLRTDPMADPLRGDPRFQALLDRVEGELARMGAAVGADTILPPAR